MDTTAVAAKIGLDDETRIAIVNALASDPSLHGRSPKDLEALLFEVLGVMTGDSPREEFPRTEIDRVVFRIARQHLEPEDPDGLTQRLAWLSLWFSVRQLRTPA